MFPESYTVSMHTPFSNSPDKIAESSVLQVSYWIDGTDTIVKVNQVWDRFALGNDGGDAVLSSKVVGRNVFDFISGDETRMYLGALLQHARYLNRTVVRPYRCDSPALRRYMEMQVSPDADGLVRLDHVLLRAEPYEVPVVYRHESDPDAEALFRCSVCSNLQVADRWFAPEDARILCGMPCDKPIPVRYAVCPSCTKKTS